MSFGVKRKDTVNIKLFETLMRSSSASYWLVECYSLEYFDRNEKYSSNAVSTFIST